jgi:tetratricopeptide (TPR) repeat protein
MKLLFVAVWLLGAAATVHAQDAAFAPGSAAAARDAGAIATARELYASARYEEALALLNGLRPSELTDPREIRPIEQYRSLCLLALGRNDEAATSIAALVTADPFYQPGEADASPRVRATFADVRQRLLPALANEHYVSAKAAYDRKAHADAERQFRDLLRLLNDPQMNGRLPDLRVLATGFVELAAAAAAPPPAPPAKPDEPAKVSTPSAPAVPPEPRIYNADDEQVKAPVVIRQDVPQVPASITSMTRDRAVIEVIIDEQGRVASMALRIRAHPQYDTMLLNAARDWKYRPATLNGTPVRYRKLLQVSIARR